MIGSVRFRAIGVDCQIVTNGNAALGPARELAEELLAQLDQAASRFRPDSEVVRLAAVAATDGTGTVTVPGSPLLLSLVADALWAAEVTDGLVDPTLGRAMEDSGYDTDLAEVLARTVGAGTMVKAATRPASSLAVLSVDKDAGTITVADGALIDLGATAKAATADRIADELARRWPGGFLVDLGGDIAVAGEPPLGGWVISTDEDSSGGAHRIGITTQGVATSGTDRRRWYVDGSLRHHLLDPATGRQVLRTWRQVTCVAASALEANTASTAACVLGRTAVGWLSERGIPARLVPENGETCYTRGWPASQVGRAS